MWIDLATRSLTHPSIRWFIVNIIFLIPSPDALCVCVCMCVYVYVYVCLFLNPTKNVNRRGKQIWRHWSQRETPRSWKRNVSKPRFAWLSSHWRYHRLNHRQIISRGYHVPCIMTHPDGQCGLSTSFALFFLLLVFVSHVCFSYPYGSIRSLLMVLLRYIIAVSTGSSFTLRRRVWGIGLMYEQRMNPLSLWIMTDIEGGKLHSPNAHVRLRVTKVTAWALGYSRYIFTTMCYTGHIPYSDGCM